MDNEIAIIISSIAILISLVSLVFSVYQYRNNQIVKKLEKSNKVLQQSYKLRQSSQDLRDKINITDDIEDFNPLLDQLDNAIEIQVTQIFNNDATTIHDAYKMEKAILSLELEFELFVKQINEAIRFNNEINEYEKTANK